MTTTIRGLRAAYGNTEILHGVDLQINPGQIVSVLGPSGSGKTTLLRAVAGLQPVTAGTITIDDRDVTLAPPERRGIGLVPQEGALFGHLTVAANIGYGIRGLRHRHAAKDPRVQELLALIELEGYELRYPHELSGGQQQRVALARALAPRPRLLLLDEPFSALDAGLRQRTRDHVAAILRSQQLSVALITHDQEEALSMSDSVVVLRDGVIAQSGTPLEMYRSPADEWIARFLGDATVVPAVAQGTTALSCFGQLRLARETYGRCRVVVRPEQIELVRPAAPALPALRASADRSRGTKPVASGTRPVNLKPHDHVIAPVGDLPAANKHSESVASDGSRPGSGSGSGSTVPQFGSCTLCGIACERVGPPEGSVTKISFFGHDSLVELQLDTGDTVRALAHAYDSPGLTDRVRVHVGSPVWPIDMQ